LPVNETTINYQQKTMKIKICGITNLEDASYAADLGVDALGFIFAKSPRQISPETAYEIIRELPPLVKTVGVFANEDVSKIKTVIEYCAIDLVQLHGDEEPYTCMELLPRTIKALRVKDESSAHEALKYRDTVRALLLDTYAKDKMGGTGETFNWELALKIKESGIPIILAGGLGPENIEEAIAKVRPYAVDLNSGVEVKPGKKDHALLRKTVEKIKGGKDGNS
jgi:phosphoribosylanthranilate isomerase